MIKGEQGFITAILTQAVEDAKYTGSNKQDIKHKMESINWIMNSDPQFTYYCKLINIEPSYVQNKIKRYSEVKYTKEQKPIVQMLERKSNESRRIGI
tara:strand:- start:459 stop:749 length:291 start_codon:yes stop_codon:yes gene_type:complete